MAIPTSGRLSFDEIENEFNGDVPLKLSNYYRGGPLVPNKAVNVKIPSSGRIQFSHFYGSATCLEIIPWTCGNIGYIGLYAPNKPFSIDLRDCYANPAAIQSLTFDIGSHRYNYDLFGLTHSGTILSTRSASTIAYERSSLRIGTLTATNACGETNSKALYLQTQGVAAVTSKPYAACAEWGALQDPKVQIPVPTPNPPANPYTIEVSGSHVISSDMVVTVSNHVARVSGRFAFNPHNISDSPTEPTKLYPQLFRFDGNLPPAVNPAIHSMTGSGQVSRIESVGWVVHYVPINGTVSATMSGSSLIGRHFSVSNVLRAEATRYVSVSGTWTYPTTA